MRQDQSISISQKLFPILLALFGLGILLIAFGSNLLGFSGGNGFGTNRLFLMMGGLVILLSGIVVFPFTQRRQMIEWLLLAVGAGGVAIAADLFIVGSLAEAVNKYILLAIIAFGFVLIKVVSLVQPGQNYLEIFRSLLKVDRQIITQFLGLVLQLALLVILVREFKLENQAFYINVMQVAFYGFLLHYFLPLQHRLPFFLFLSLAALLGIFGIANGLWIVGVGVSLIGIVHLPIPFWIRIVVLILVGGVLAFSRAGVFQTVPVVVWPILSSLFMFRLMVYVYDLKHSKKPMNFWSTLSYFFLFPNIVFPFFPVVDHNTFVRTYYNEEEHRIYQTGVNWIYRGVVQLILYRAVYYYVAISPDEVTTGVDLVWFAYSSFLLYLQVSGQFHLIIGLLHLFGFNLPQTNDRYFLSANYNDLWRRVNIYWKDFMQKIFYYPAYHFLSKRGISGTPALVLTTVYVFVATWFFHAYQWFWLRGSFLFTATDVVFWVILALLVIFNTLRETKQGRTRTLGTRAITNKELVILGVKNMATISFLTFLWTMWTSPTLRDWLGLWALALKPLNLLTLMLCLAGLTVVFIGLNWYYKRFIPATPVNKQPQYSLRPILVNSLCIFGIFLLGNPAVYNRIGGQPRELFSDLTTSRLSDRDANMLLRGYYEDLIGVNRFNSELWDVYSKRPTDWPLLQETEAAQITDDFSLIELTPSITLNFHGEQFTINKWGMRDQEYELVALPDTYRIALVGPSFVMGSGAADDEVFEWILEDTLNEQYGGGKYARYEILNFAVAGHSALQELYVFEQAALPFKPNALFYFAHQMEETIIVRNLANRIRVGSEIPYEYLNDLILQAGVDPSQSQEDVEKLLKPYGSELLAWTYQQIAFICKENGILPVWVFMPTLEVSDSPGEQSKFTNMAEEAGFITLDLSKIYEGQDISMITVAEWDLHPNGKGHELIAENLYQALLANSETAGALGLDQ